MTTAAAAIRNALGQGLELEIDELLGIAGIVSLQEQVAGQIKRDAQEESGAVRREQIVLAVLLNLDEREKPKVEPQLEKEPRGDIAEENDHALQHMPGLRQGRRAENE